MSSERRTAPRIGCRIPVLLQGQWTSVQADVADLSRAGARLQVPVSQLGLAGGAGLSEVARQLRLLLTKDVQTQFFPAQLGSLIQRRIHPVRIGRIIAEDPIADIGCFFNEPLSPVEAAALGLIIPMEGETFEEAQSYQKAVSPQSREPEHTSDGEVEILDEASLLAPRPSRLRAYVIPTARPDQEPLVGYVGEASPHFLEITLPERRALELPMGCRDLGRIQAAFKAACGDTVVLGLADGETRVWSGRACLNSVEMSAQYPQGLVLTFELDRPLKPGEVPALV